MANASDPSLSRVSLCLIVRNEASPLARCLRSVADLVREMIVVDTGSTDRTREVAAELGRGSSTSPGATASPPPVTG